MQYLITGGTGFIGRRLVHRLLNEGHQVVVLSRQPAKEVRLQLSTRVKPVSSLSAVNPASYFDAVINLAGEGILDKRWSRARKKTLLDSRIGVTSELVDLIERMENRPGCFISASAIGYYGFSRPGEELDESAEVGSDFAATLCDRWEQVARRVEALGVRTCIVRIGVVLHPSGGALQKMLPVFRLGLGGPIGSGRQIMSWIHMDDMLNALLYLVNHPEIKGVFNAVSPEILTNKAFAKELGRAVRRPAILTTPESVLALMLGESAQLLTEGQAVTPRRLQEAGFTFAYPNARKALASLLAYLR
ncbi:TIGR01777 family oxidoreductase [Endozoicomonas sp. GU-1]|uniref:TIGR01777 family oxidoreductase n=1 Tax=Endozoicomonas sp. GU-1 TaxID=3009078 RepID=UPI0022B334E4|nr:TIGR01777 family oxidoreductase [Endozoicomonas sp. GU-1]WBA80556.1 TIGR01777 family oxidoreductase [Endozoicomonas sp. GU-1]WBA88124.1 TIGR01777 family oxidoreductase [Endozoicomonas sp. GU-1]